MEGGTNVFLRTTSIGVSLGPSPFPSCSLRFLRYAVGSGFGITVPLVLATLTLVPSSKNLKDTLEGCLERKH